MAESQFSTPVLLKEDSPTALARVRVDDLDEDEDWLQRQLFRLPLLLPAEAVHVDFANPAPVAREVPTDSGPIDLLFVNPSGCLTIVETKLRRNPEARRKVIAQLIDYASALARLSYEDLLRRVRGADVVASQEPDPILAAARSVGGTTLNEDRFKRAVAENVGRGRFLMLIVVDESHETVERMVEFFSAAPQQGFLLQFTLALLEIAVFRAGPKGNGLLLLQPRLAAKTREITRAVVEIRFSGGRPAAEQIVADPATELPPPDPRPESTTERNDPEAFFNKLASAIGGEAAGWAREMFAEVVHRDLVVQWKRNGPILKWFDSSKRDFNFGQLTPEGKLACSGWLGCKCVRQGIARAVWQPYFDALAGLVPGCRLTEVREKGEEEPFINVVVGPDDEDPPLLPLLRNRERWLEAISATIERLRDLPQAEQPD